MNEIKRKIDEKLKDITLSENIVDNIKNGKRIKKKNQLNAVLPVFIMCAILIPTVYAVTNMFTLSVNGEKMPELDEMRVISIRTVEGLNNDNFQKKYSKISDVENELGVTFLKSDLCDEKYHLINYTRLGKEYSYIEIGAYIVGDLKNITYNDEIKYYDWEYGNEYQTPINLKIEMITDSEQQPFDTEYLGEYKYLESIESDRGNKVNILEQTGTMGKPGLCAIFVSDGIRYTLTGHVYEDTMIEIINSMK